MKTAKRVLAILMAMLMAVSVFAVAASAAGSLQTAIDNAAAGATVSISKNTKESVKINKDLTLDLGGKILKSIEGSPAITVTNGAKVTVTNGYVEAYCTKYSGATMETLDIFKKLPSKAPSAIVAYGSGTEVTLTDVRAMGGLIRIPKTSEYYAPVGSAVKIYNGAKTVLNNAVLMGSYGVSNDPKNLGTADGIVEINDALLFGFMDYVKRANGIVYDAETVEKVNAADRIAGYLNDNIKLNAKEVDLLKKVMDDRVYIFTAKPTDDKAVVTINRETGWAKITAEEVKDLAVTDCSYKYIPENAYDVATGKTYALDTDIPAAELDGKEIRINYRLAFELKGDIKDYANRFDYWFNYIKDKGFQKLDSGVNDVLAKYEGKIKEFANVFEDLDENAATQVTLGGETKMAADMLGDDFYAVERAIIALGGVKMYNKTAAGAADGFTTKKFASALYNYGAAAPAAGSFKVDPTPAGESRVRVNGEWVKVPYYNVTEIGTLDKLDKMLNEFLALKGDSFANQANWAAMVQYVANNYQNVLDLIDEAQANLIALKAALNTGKVAQVIDLIGMKSKIKMVDNMIAAIDEVQNAIDEALGNSIVAEVKAKVDNHQTAGTAIDPTVKEYVGKVKRFVNDYTTYFTPEDFLLESGAYGKAYRVNGPTKVEIIEAGKLNVKVSGNGTVAYAPDTAADGSTKVTSFVGINYTNSVTLTAAADAGNEFLYYYNDGTERILSTNPTLVIDTQIERYIVAVFAATSQSQVTFTNASGVIAETKAFNDLVDAGDIAVSLPANYKATGWGPKGTSVLTSADFVSAYQNGTSAFENGAVYDNKGYAFKLNATTANKYLATPKFDANLTYSVKFQDGENVWGNDTLKAGNTITYTATGSNFSYWENAATHEIVSVYPTYSAMALKNIVLKAVYGATTPEYAMTISPVYVEDVRIRVYGERSIAANRKVLSTGFIISNTDRVTEPTVADVNRDDVRMTVSTLKTNQGVATVGNTFDKIASYDGVAYIRAFAELQTATGSEFVYSPVAEYEMD